MIASGRAQSLQVEGVNSVQCKSTADWCCMSQKAAAYSSQVAGASHVVIAAAAAAVRFHAGSCPIGTCW